MRLMSNWRLGLVSIFIGLTMFGTAIPVGQSFFGESKYYTEFAQAPAQAGSVSYRVLTLEVGPISGISGTSPFAFEVLRFELSDPDGLAKDLRVLGIRELDVKATGGAVTGLTFLALLEGRNVRPRTVVIDAEFQIIDARGNTQRTEGRGTYALRSATQTNEADTYSLLRPVVTVTNDLPLLSLVGVPILENPLLGEDGNLPANNGPITCGPDGCPDPNTAMADADGVTDEASIDPEKGEPYASTTGDADMGRAGRSPGYSFERTYRSRMYYNGPLGHNWDFNYNRRLVEVGANNLSVVQFAVRNAKAGDVFRMDGYGRTDLYVRNPDGSYTPPTGFYTKLTKNPDGTFEERDRDGDRWFYLKPDANGLARLSASRDRNGNTIKHLYNEKGQLVRTLDVFGGTFDYRYNDDGRIIELKDFSGRTVRFQYDQNGDLVAVTRPAVTGTPNGNDFPQGKTMRYTYTSGFQDERYNHNLLTITAPNEVAVNGPPRVIFEYTRPGASQVDRVTRVTIGGKNQSGIPAGGTIRYEFRRLGLPQAGDFISAVSQTIVTDRNGNRTEYQFNQLGNIVRRREFNNRRIRPGDPEFVETRLEYNKDGELTKITYPEGNTIEYVYDDKNLDRFQQGNLLRTIRRPDAKRGGDQTQIATSQTYEPIYNQVRSFTDERGFTTTYTYDYQEGTNFAALAKELGISEAEVRARLERAGIPMGLGDINKDGRTDQINGNVIRIERPTVTLLPACPSDELTAANPNCSLQARLEGTSRQPIVEFYQYNQFGQLLKRIDPEGNVDIYDYHPENDPDGDGKDLTPGVGSGPFGWLKQIVRDAVSDPVRNSKTNPSPAQILTRYFYSPWGDVIKEIDGRGIATEYSVNQLRQVVEITRAADVSEALKNPEEPKWQACTDQTLIECKAGMVAFKYRTRIFYDHNNNVVKREIENRDSNNKELAGDFITYEFKYDILDNLIEETQEVSENPREILVTKYRYDRNENRVLEISPVANLPAGHPERQPSNVVSYVFDERDLLFTSTRGGLTDQFKALAAHADIPELRQIPNSPDISTFARVYDLNRNLKESIDAADNTGDGKPEVTTYLYDGFDRQVSVIDAVGNQSFTQYDPASNVVRVSNFGPVGGKSPTSNAAATFTQPLTLQSFRQPLLSQVEYKYDELNRQFERDDKLFVYQGVEYKRAPVLQDGPLGSSNDGIVVTRYEYDRNSRRTFTIEDDLSVFQTRYDGVDRVIREIDPELNEVLSTYDDNNNTVKVVEIEITQRSDVAAGKVPDLKETFTTLNVYDSLDRLIRTTDNLGQITRNHYDSRNNLIFTSDAQHSKDNAELIADPLGLFPSDGQDSRGVTRINKPGNTMEYFYDGINRKISEVRHLRVDGQGKNPIDTSNPANPDGLIVIDYDANSRLVAMADDGSLQGDQNTSIGVIEPTNPKGNVTRYVYDDLNRQAREIFDDNTCNVYSYDPDDNLRRMVDENGSIIVNVYDGINRLMRKDVTRATSATPHPAGCFKDSSISWQVIGTTLQEFEYDGLSRMTRSFDNNEPEDVQDDATVTNAYDSLSRLLEEVQNGHAVSSRWMGDNNRVGLVYPNGRELEYTFDKLDRINTIKDKGASKHIVDYDYLGPGRVLERIYTNGVRLTYLDDARQRQIGYDGLRRVVLHRHLRQDNSLVAGFAYDYDRANNKLFEIKQHDNNRKEDYTYDSLYRLLRFARQGEPEDTWQLDGVGNWASRKGVANQANNLNEYTSFAGATQLHDDNGNLIDDGTNRYQYDFANRLRRVSRKSDGALIAVYSYDASDRRIRKIVTNSGDLNGTTMFYLDGGQEIEERVVNDALLQQYVYGIYIDEPILLDRNLNKDDTAIGPDDQRMFYHDNSLSSILALTDSNGVVLEGYLYDAYGQQTVYALGPNGIVDFGNDDIISPNGNSLLMNPYLYTGRRQDQESKQYYYRKRYLNPQQGRFIQRDPAKHSSESSFYLSTKYEYVAGNPLNVLDPLGLSPCPPPDPTRQGWICGVDWSKPPEERGKPHGQGAQVITLCREDCCLKWTVVWEPGLGRVGRYPILIRWRLACCDWGGRICETRWECKKVKIGREWIETGKGRGFWRDVERLEWVRVVHTRKWWGGKYVECSECKRELFREPLIARR
jgi:RHS repeat-associated protein